MKKKLIPRALNGTQVLPRTISLELLIGETTTPVITVTPWRYTGRIKKPGMTEFIMPK